MFPSLLDTTILIVRIPFLPGLPKLFLPETVQGSGRGQAQSEGDPQHHGTCITETYLRLSPGHPSQSRGL